MFTSHHFQRHYQNCESTSTPQSGTSHKTCLRGFGGNGSIAWTSAVSHVGRTSNACKVAMKLQTFLFQMVVTLCISVQYLWQYGFAKYSDHLYAPCIYTARFIMRQACFRCHQWDTKPKYVHMRPKNIRSNSATVRYLRSCKSPRYRKTPNKNYQKEKKIWTVIQSSQSSLKLPDNKHAYAEVRVIQTAYGYLSVALWPIRINEAMRISITDYITLAYALY